MPSTTSREWNSSRSKVEEEPVIIDNLPTIREKKGFGRELFTTEGHETIRELNGGEETPSSDDAS